MAPADQPVATDPALAPPPHVGVTNPAAQPTPAAVAAPSDPITAALRDKLAALPTEGSAQEIKERAVLSDYYNASHAPLWVGAGGLTPKGGAVIAELMKAGDWGLDPGDFALPHIADAAMANLTPAEVADAEVAISLAVLKYARFARGGRIIDPTILLTSQFDRKPQLLDPEVVFAALAAADAPDAYLRGVHPKQPQFEKLRQAYLANRGKPLAKKLLANMEEWRWMPDDLGQLHILANVPEFMVYLYKDDKVIHTRAHRRRRDGQADAPSSRAPQDHRVQADVARARNHQGQRAAAQPAARRQHVPPVRPRARNQGRQDARLPLDRLEHGRHPNYEVMQPPGRKNVMGVVKFTFPSQHTIFMHDTVDKWMFAQSQRTLSHGCLRLRNPMKMAELVLAEDKGWDAAKVEQLDRSRPAQQRDRDRKEDPDPPRLLHGVGGR